MSILQISPCSSSFLSFMRGKCLRIPLTDSKYPRNRPIKDMVPASVEETELTHYVARYAYEIFLFYFILFFFLKKYIYIYISLCTVMYKKCLFIVKLFFDISFYLE